VRVLDVVGCVFLCVFSAIALFVYMSPRPLPATNLFGSDALSVVVKVGVSFVCVCA